jgi:hypothetical protein
VVVGDQSPLFGAICEEKEMVGKTIMFSVMRQECVVNLLCSRKCSRM